MISGETMKCRKVRRILRYHVPNNILYLEKLAHYVLLLFYSFRDEKELLSGFPKVYQNKLQHQGVLDIVNRNKINFKPYGDLIDQFFLKIMRLLSTLRISIAKMKMIKHH